MAMIYGRNEFGYIVNGDFSSGTNQNFTFGTINSTDAYSGKFCLERIGGGGSTYISPIRLEVDPTKTYQMIMYARTLELGGTGGTNLAGGHLGFSCYDRLNRFIDLRHCGGIGNTYLTRPLVAGDTDVYIESFSGWAASGSTNFFRHIMLYPPTHPDYSTPHAYTRYGLGDVDLYYGQVEQLSGEVRLQLVNSVGTPITFPSMPYPTPAGTPVSNGQAGGTFNYALGAPDYPTSWTIYATPPFTGESRNSAYPFRFGTKFISFMVLLNYNKRTDAVQTHKWAIDNVFFGQCLGGRDYRDSL
jgi:hypothetical protein